MISPLWVIVALAAMLVIDLIAFTARAAFQQVTHARLLGLREGGDARLKRALALLPVMPRLRSSLNLVLVGTRFGIAGLVIWFVLLRPVGQYTPLAAALGLAAGALITFWLEWAVERIAQRSPEATAMDLGGAARILMAISSPWLSPLALGTEAQAVIENQGGVTQDELKTLVDAGEEEGVLQVGEKRMIYSVFELSNTVAREVMVPRIDILALEVTTPLAEAIDAMLAAGHSRVPVYEETVDNTLGLLYAKDLLRAWRQEARGTSLREMLRPAHFVPESKKLDELLAEMQSRRIHMAIIVDEYGGVAGLVTLEDIVEEFLGEIQDEYDTGEEAPYQRLPDGSCTFQGRIGLADFNEIMESDISDEDADTLGGYIYGRLARVPNVGETVQAGSLLLTVEQVSARRIRRVHARWLETDEQKKDDERVDG